MPKPKKVKTTPEQRQKMAAEAIRGEVKGLRGVKGNVICPSCQGNLEYTVIAFNGRIRANCDTPGCTQFEE